MTNYPGWIAAGAVCAGAAVAARGAVAARSQIFGRTIVRTGDASAIALTFDDGPNPSVTPALLDELEKHGAKGTFFAIGKHVRAFSKVAAEIAERGHTIGNHTETHPRLTLCGPRQTREELERCDEAIAEATGLQRTRWMRPPYGYRSPWLDGIVRERNGAEVVMWSAMARDWTTNDASDVIQRLRGVRGGDIVLLHDGNHRVLEGERGHVLAALQYWMPRWKDAGIGFLSLDEMYKNREANRIP